jgi:hypothetical protein
MPSLIGDYYVTVSGYGGASRYSIVYTVDEGANGHIPITLSEGYPIRGTATIIGNKFQLYKIDLRDKKDLTITIQGEGSHFIAYVSKEKIPTHEEYNWSFTDYQIGFFKLGTKDIEFLPTATYYIRVEPYFEIASQIDYLNHTFYIEYKSENDIKKPQKLLMNKANKG